MENKRVTALAAIMLVAFGGVCYYGYSQYRRYCEASRIVEETADKLEGYRSDKMPPTDGNRRRISKAASTVAAISASFAKDINRYAEVCAESAEKIDPSGFQKAVNDMTAAVAAYAREKKCTLSADAAALGLNEYKTAPATERDTPYLNFMLRAADGLVRHVIDAGAQSVTRVYCAPLPEEVGSRRKPPFFPLEMELVFTATRNTADIDTTREETLNTIPRFFNAVTGDRRYFYVITGISVRNTEVLPTLPPYRAPVAVGDSLTPPPTDEDAEADASQAEQAGSVAKLIVGRGGTVQVNVTLQVYYFTATGKR